MQSQFPDSPFTKAGSAPSAPPPPSEVKVRTMRSDLDSMARSGGGLPRFENVKIENLSIGKAAPPQGAAAPGPAAAPEPKSGLMMLLAAAAILAVLGAGAFFVYRVYLGGSLGSARPSGPVAGGRDGRTAGGAPVTPPAAASAVPAPAAPFSHASFFKKPADQTFALAPSSANSASSATDLATFNQKLSAILARAGKTSTMIEIAMQKADGSGVAAGDVLSQANIPLLDPALLSAHFVPDETFFVYRDAAGGQWPGVVLSLKPGENWLFVKNDVAKLESSPAAIANFFLTNAGTPSPDGFADGAVSSTPVRVLPFLTPTSSAYFAYGWDKAYLILSTSQRGFAEAAARL